MKVLVTGAGGFLGTHLVRALVKRGLEVHTLGRNHYPKLDIEGVRQFKGDIRTQADVEEAMKECTGVFHVAGKVGIWGKPSEFESINVDGTKTVISVMKKFGVNKLVLTSSPSVAFGKDDLIGVDEKTPYPDHYIADYPRTKSLAEQYALSEASDDFHIIGLRPHLIYGREDLNLLPRVLERARQGKLRIIGKGDNMVDIIHVDNAVHAHLCAWDALLKGPVVNGKSYFVANSEPVSLWGFINRILEINQLPKVYKHVPLWFTYLLAALFEKVYKVLDKYDSEPPLTRFSVLQMAKSHYFSHEAAERDIGYRPIVSFEESLKDLDFRRS